MTDTTRVRPPDARARRIADRVRADKWKLPPLAIVAEECINCDACLAACPPAFGAVFRHGAQMVIVPELCSGCGKCLAPVCPVDCIVEADPSVPTPDALWAEAAPGSDPYRTEDGAPRRAADLAVVRRW